MSEVEHLVHHLTEAAWYQGVRPSPPHSTIGEAERAILSLYATAIRERDEARALATQAGKALRVLFDATKCEDCVERTDACPDPCGHDMGIAKAALLTLRQAGLEV